MLHILFKVASRHYLPPWLGTNSAHTGKIYKIFGRETEGKYKKAK